MYVCTYILYFELRERDYVAASIRLLISLAISSAASDFKGGFIQFAFWHNHTTHNIYMVVYVTMYDRKH